MSEQNMPLPPDSSKKSATWASPQMEWFAVQAQWEKRQSCAETGISQVASTSQVGAAPCQPMSAQQLLLAIASGGQEPHSGNADHSDPDDCSDADQDQAADRSMPDEAESCKP